MTIERLMQTEMITDLDSFSLFSRDASLVDVCQESSYNSCRANKNQQEWRAAGAAFTGKISLAVNMRNMSWEEISGISQVLSTFPKSETAYGDPESPFCRIQAHSAHKASAVGSD